MGDDNDPQQNNKLTASNLSKQLKGEGAKHSLIFLNVTTLELTTDFTDISKDPENYALIAREEGWLKCTPWSKAEENTSSENAGPAKNRDWKFHLSIDVSKENQENYDRAWSIILPILAKNKILFKAYDPINQKESFGIPKNQGMEFTIYGDNNKSHEEMLMIMAEIEVKLTEAGIEPQKRQFADTKETETRYATCCKPLHGSQYISYRNEKHYFKTTIENTPLISFYVSRENVSEETFDYINKKMIDGGKTKTALLKSLKKYNDHHHKELDPNNAKDLHFFLTETKEGNTFFNKVAYRLPTEAYCEKSTRNYKEAKDFYDVSEVLDKKQTRKLVIEDPYKELDYKQMLDKSKESSLSTTAKLFAKTLSRQDSGDIIIDDNNAGLYSPTTTVDAGKEKSNDNTAAPPANTESTVGRSTSPRFRK